MSAEPTPAKVFRVSCRDASGKVHSTSFSLRKHSAEEARALGEAWKKKIKGGPAPPVSDAPILPKPAEPLKEPAEPPKPAGPQPPVAGLLESRPFELDLPPDAFTVAILASSRAGKTSAIRHIFRERLRKFITILVAPHSFADAYQGFKPDRNLVRAMELHDEVLRAAHKLQKRSKMAFRICFILDDFTDRDDRNARALFLNMRNAKISTILATQSPKLLAKSARGSVNWLLFGRFNSDEQIRDAIETFLSSYLPGKIEEKIALDRQLTADYHWLALDQLNDRLVRLKPAPQ